MRQPKIEVNQKVLQHLVPVFFEQMPKYDDQAKQSSRQKQELVLIEIRFYMSLKRLYLNIPFY